MCVSANPKRVVKFVNLTLLVGVDCQTVTASDPTRRRLGNLPRYLLAQFAYFLRIG